MKTETALFLDSLRRSIHSGPLLLPAPREIHTCRTLNLHAYIYATILKRIADDNCRTSNPAGKAAEWYNEKINDDTFCQLAGEDWVLSENASYCENCEEHFNADTENFTTVRTNVRRSHDTEDWCETCTCNRAFRCSQSREYFQSSEFTEVYVEGETVCLEENGDEMYYWDSEDEYHWEPEPEEPEEPEDGVQGYHNSPRSWINRDYGSALLYGVELELKATGSREDVADLATDLGFLAEEDGSLDDTYGIEVIGAPMKFSDYGADRSPWLEFLRDVRGKAIGWDAGTGYGLHVSVNRRALTDYHVGKMLVFVNENRTLCEKVAGRKEVSWAMYRDKKLTSGKRDYSEKYEALAIRSRSRLEFRIFRSTLSPEGFLRAVEFTAAIVEFTRISSAIGLTEKSFRGFLALHATEYRHLARHLGIHVPVREKPLKLETATAA